MTETTTRPTVPSGHEVIKTFVRTLPSAPGVYRMIDAAGEVIYVGKARSLKARVTNYTRPEGLPVRIQRMIAATTTMEFVRTETESEALLLEANLIKRLKPRFNVLLRDDKSFPYILIATEHEAPELMKHRGTRRRKGHYFGPFASVTAVNRTIASLQKAFLLRNCSDSFYAARTRPCLQHQIKRCAAPCTREISIEGYNELVEEAREFLSGRSQGVRDHLQRDMNQAAEQLDFERAALLRDRLSALALIQSQGDATAKSVEEADVFAIHHEGGQFCVQVFFFRAFQNWGNHAFRPRADSIPYRRRSARSLHQPVLRKPHPAPAGADQPRTGRARADGRSPYQPRRIAASMSKCPSAAKSATWSITPSTMPARPWAASLPKAPPTALCSKASPNASASTNRPAASRSTTTPTSRAPMPSAP